MSPATVVWLVWLAILALATIRYWMLRSWRTALFLLFGAVAVMAIDQLDIWPTTALQAGVAAAITSVMLVRSEPLWAMRVADRQFVEAFAAIRVQIKDLRNRIDTTPVAEYARDFEAIIRRLEAINPPTDDWTALQTETASDLRLRLGVLRGDKSDDGTDTPQDRWRELDLRFKDLIKAKTSFWLLWPWS